MLIFDIKKLAEAFGIDLDTIKNPSGSSDHAKNEPSK
jgi:hypothetical protein